MAYIKLSAEEKQDRKKARQEAKNQEQSFDELFWTIDERAEELVPFDAEEARYTYEEAKMMVKLAYEAGKAEASAVRMS